MVTLLFDKAGVMPPKRHALCTFAHPSEFVKVDFTEVYVDA